MQENNKAETLPYVIYSTWNQYPNTRAKTTKLLVEKKHKGESSWFGNFLALTQEKWATEEKKQIS